MIRTSRFFASFTFAGIAVFLVINSWLPALDRLRQEEGQITSISPRKNTWYAVDIITSSGVRLSCRARRGWPLAGPSRCPLEKFEQHLGQSVSVIHNGKRPYQVSVGNQVLLDYSAHRRAQLVAVTLAGLLLAMACWVWRRE